MFLRLPVVGLLVCASIVAACEPSPSLGNPCVRNSDCTAPLECGAGRCRVACLEARDCTIPLDCLMVAEDVGVCALNADDDCAGACEAPLICMDRRCRQPCTLAPDCAAGMACDHGICVRPAPVGACDPLDDEGCGAGETCRASGTTLACQPSVPGTGVTGSPCSADTDCETGYVCPANEQPPAGIVGRAERQCVRLCTLSPESACGASASCRSTTSRTNGAASAEVPDGFGVCTEPCELGTSEGCPAGESCTVGDFDADHVIAYCTVVDVTASEFDECTGVYQCPPNTHCQPGLVDPIRRCRPFCETDEDCSPSSDCELHGELTDGRPIRACSTPT